MKTRGCLLLLYYCCEILKERERERQRDRETERQRERERQRDREREREPPGSCAKKLQDLRS